MFASFLAGLTESTRNDFSTFRFRTALSIFALGAALFLVAPVAKSQSVAPQFVYTAQSGFSQVFGFQLNTTTGALTPIPGSPFSERQSPAAMAVNPAGTLLFVANGNGDNNVSVFSINTTTGVLSEVANSPFASGLGVDPKVIATDPSGKFLYVGNTNGVQFNSAGQVDVYAINSVTG